MIQPRTKTIDTTRGETRIRALKAKEHNQFMRLQMEMLKADGEAEKLEVAGRMQDIMRGCCEMPQPEWDELEAWEATEIIDQVKKLSFDSLEKN